MEHSKILE